MAFVQGKRRANPKKRRQASTGFDEGLNQLAHPSMLKDNELSEFVNGMYSQYGTLIKRKGTVKIGQPAENATQIRTGKSVYIGNNKYHFRISDNGKPEVYSFSNKTWSYFTGTAPVGYSGTSPSFAGGTPVFNTTVKTHIVLLANRIYFLNESDQMTYWEDNKWYVYTPLPDPTTKPTVTKTGTGTGSATYFYYYVYYNEVGGTVASPHADPELDANGQGYYKDMPIALDKDTYLTMTIPTPPAGTTRVGIFRSDRQGIGYYITSVDPSQTTFVDKGENSGDTYFGLPTYNDTKGQKFKLVDVFQDKLIGVTTEGGDETLYWTGEPYTSPTGTASFSVVWGGGFLPYRLGDGGKIRGIKAFVSSNESGLLVFKDSAFGRFTFNELGGQIQDINIAIGSLSPESLHIAGNNFRFYSRDGASSVGHEANYGNLLRYSILSLRVDAITSQVTANNLPYVCAEYYKNLSIFGISNSSSPKNNSCLVYDERYNSWAYWTGIFANSFFKMVSDVDGIERLYYCSNNSPDVLEMFSGKTDNGTTGTNGTKINLSITTKQYDMGLSDQFKRFDEARFVFGALSGTNTTIGVSYMNEKGIIVLPRLMVDMQLTQSGMGAILWGDALMGQPDIEVETVTNSIVRYINLRQRDMFWVKFNIQNDGLADEFSLLSIFIYYSISGRRLGHRLRIRRLAEQV